MVSSATFTGRVKWFNAKTGFGFITIISDPETACDHADSRVGKDVFAHHTSLKVPDNTWRYLVQGEYVEFALTSKVSEKYEFQTEWVSGIGAGKLLCETRAEIQNARPASQRRGGGPREHLSNDAPRGPSKPSLTRQNTTDHA